VHAQWQEFADMSGSPAERGFATLLPAPQLSTKLASLGIDSDKTVVVYADTRNGWGEDGRLVWMLRMCGVRKARMLNGGIGYWKDHGFAVQRGETEPTPTAFSVDSLDSSYVATTDYVYDHLDSVALLDSRTKAEYEGVAHEWEEARTGHLPGAVHLPFDSVYDSDGTLKNRQELLALFADAGVVDRNAVVVSYCTGVSVQARYELIPT
jgi:thiosulfate/3-mercaptopyruvate sulfurtransferase